MDRTFDPLPLLLELDARHDELLRRLDELDNEVARVLKETQLLVKADVGPFQPAPLAGGEQHDALATPARAA